jgi:hypothetical protein
MAIILEPHSYLTRNPESQRDTSRLPAVEGNQNQPTGTTFPREHQQRPATVHASGQLLA